MSMLNAQPADERAAAAQRRAAECGGAQVSARRRAPSGLSLARMAAFPATLRAESMEHGGQQRHYLTGHASVVDQPYEMWDSYGPYMEVIERRAFTKTLAARPDVAFLVNHRGVTMARTTNDSLRISMDDVGLRVEAWLNPKRQDVTDLILAVEDRDITEMSFAFMLGADGGTWSSDFSEFHISELDIHRGDVSVVNYGANPYTDVGARSREILADLDHLPAGAARAALDRLRHRGDIAPVTERPAPTETPDAGRSVTQVDAWLAAIEATR